MLPNNSKIIKLKITSTADNVSNVNVDALHATSPLIAVTAATSHFAEMNAKFLKNIKLADPPISILCPSGTYIQSTHTTEFVFDDSPPHQRVHSFPTLAPGSLLSVGQLCDSGCYAIFHMKTVQIIYNNKRIWIGTRSVTSNGLWIVNVKPPSANESSSCNILGPISTDNSGNDLNNFNYFCNVFTPHNSIQVRVRFS